jgi:hypothetical protein
MHYDARTLVIHQTFTSDNTPKGMPLPSVWVTALNLAVVTARDFGTKTLLLERDFKAPSISRHFKVDLESNLIDLLTSQTDSRSTPSPLPIRWQRCSAVYGFFGDRYRRKTRARGDE